MKLVVDASVIVKWFVQEDRRQMARHILERGDRCLTPDLAIVEVAGAFDKKIKNNEMALDSALAALRAIRRDLEFRPARDLIEDAARLALKIGHPIADCVYLACAIVDDCLLVTADRIFEAKARDAGFADHIALLGADPRLPISP